MVTGRERLRRTGVRRKERVLLKLLPWEMVVLRFKILPCSQLCTWPCSLIVEGGDCCQLYEIHNGRVSHVMHSENSFKLVEHDIINEAFRNQPEEKVSGMLFTHKKE